MIFDFLNADIREQKLLSWSSVGFLIFISAFLWAPSRDGLQGVYALAFFLPMLLILVFRKPNFNEYGGWLTIIALIYTGFSTLSTLWGTPKDFGFFLLQWWVLATWLCGSCLLFVKREIDIQKYLEWLVFFGVVITLSTFIYYYKFVDANFTFVIRLIGWNVFRNPNEIGALFGIVALLAFTIALQSSLLKRVWLFYFCALIAVVGLVASFSRGALLAFVLMALIALIVVRPPLKIWLPPIVTAVVVILVFLPATNIQYNYLDGRGEGFGLRANVWKEVFDRSRENIFTGIGMDKDTSIIIPDVDVFNHAHNAWLDTLYRTGLIGLALVLLHLLGVFRNFSRDPRLLPLYMWLGYGCICNLFDGRCFFWEIGAKWFLYWIPVGLIVAIHTGISARTAQTSLEK
jgi:O-antigen ligase